MPTITAHCRRQAEAKGIALAAILHVLDHPETEIPSTRKTPEGRVENVCKTCGRPQRKVMGTGPDGTRLCVVVNPCCAVVITVWLDGVETVLRADQRANGVRGYHGRDGRWRAA